MKWLYILILPLYTLTAQDFKSDISVVQFSAPFTKNSEISLKPFKSYNTYTFHITEKKRYLMMKKSNIYLPLYYTIMEMRL